VSVSIELTFNHMCIPVVNDPGVVFFVVMMI
jgi:hypothetical protein